MLTRYTNAQIQNTLVVVVNTLSTVLTFKMTVLPKNWLFSQLKFKSLFLGPHSSEVWLQRTLLGFFCSLKELEYHSGPPTQCKKNPHWTYTHNRASFLVEKGFESERVIMAVRRRDPFKMHPIRIESLQSFLQILISLKVDPSKSKNLHIQISVELNPIRTSLEFLIWREVLLKCSGFQIRN